MRERPFSSCRLRKSLGRSGSYYIVTTAAVEPTTNTVASPSKSAAAASLTLTMMSTAWFSRYISTSKLLITHFRGHVAVLPGLSTF